VQKCVVNAEVITKGQRPLLLTSGGKTIDLDHEEEDHVRNESA
jgi:hypothetical protein